jgi:hypothetical protein
MNNSIVVAPSLEESSSVIICCHINPSELSKNELTLFSLFNLCVHYDNQDGGVQFALKFYRDNDFVTKTWNVYIKYANAIERAGSAGHDVCTQRLLPYVHPDFRIFDAYDEYDDWTALENAVFGGHIDVVKVLLNGTPCAKRLPLLRIHKANVNSRDAWLRTPLFLSTHGTEKNNNVCDLVKMLIEAGADIKLRDKDKHDFILETIAYQKPQVALEILTYIDDQNLLYVSKVPNEVTPLHYAAYFSDRKVVKFLLQAGFDSNTIVPFIIFRGGDHFRFHTPIFLAAQSHYIGYKNAWGNILDLIEWEWKNINANDDRITILDIFSAPDQVLLKNYQLHFNASDQVLLREYQLKKAGMPKDISHILAMLSWFNNCAEEKRLCSFAIEVLNVPLSIYNNEYQINRHWWFVNQIILHGGVYSPQVHRQIDRKGQFQLNMRNLKIAKTHIEKLALCNSCDEINFFNKVEAKLVNEYYGN